ncbi:MAG: ATP-binding cassette domain-containing protein [Tatlockia sp.]|jgi:polar amino acid transport system ATP-binding protein
MLVIENACKSFNTLPILKQVSLHVEANTVLGLAGPSGSGKSTLLRCIQGLDSLDSGTIHCAGKSGFMFQDFQLFPHMTVLKNLIYAPRLHHKTGHHEEKARQLLHTLGIADKANAYPHQLSGGQKQRVALARSLMINPALLLCDEPTSGLDKATVDEVILLLHTAKGMGVTMLIASHDLDFLSRIADRLVLLKNGEFITERTPPFTPLNPYYQE